MENVLRATIPIHSWVSLCRDVTANTSWPVVAAGEDPALSGLLSN